MRSEIFFILLSCFISVNSISQEEYDIKHFRTSLFKWHTDEGYYYVNLGLEKGAHIVSFIDFDINKNKYTDLVTYRKGDSQVDFYMNSYDQEKGKFIQDESPFFTVDGSDVKVTNVYTGHLVEGQEYGFIITVKINDNYKTYFLGSNKSTFATADISPVFIGDINGDRNTEVIAYDKSLSQRKVYYITLAGGTLKLDAGDFSEILADNSNINDAAYKYMEYEFTSLGAAFIDVDGDCRNDLILSSKDSNGNQYLEIYRGRSDKSNQKIKYVLNEENGIISLGTEKLGAFNLGDFNDDGFVDLIFPIIDDSLEKPKVKVIYNKNVLDYYWADKYCEKHKEYTDTVPVVFKWEEAKEYELDLPNYYFAKLDLTPSILKIADLKNKAFPAFGAIFSKKNSEKKTIGLFLNKYQEKKENIFDIDTTIEQDSANYMSFFDLDENGNIDILIDTDDGTLAVYNNYFSDTYFIKAKTLLSDSLYSAEVGTNYRYIATDNDGKRRMDYSWQLAMTADLAMSTPYSLVGIGRSNNYIENLIVISTSYDSSKAKGDDTYLISPVIPKTQLLIKKKLNSEKIEWNVDLIVSPTEKLLLMMIVIGAILILILLIIIILHVRETKEDKKQESGTEQFKSWFN
ncbi:MAG: hypothetical protein MJ252_12500 [archaeon]|nr:hypothetical protein [archaeon]